MAEHKADRVLLPTWVKPVNYQLHFTPDLKKFTFAGSAVVDVVVKETTKTLILHALELELSKVSFQAANGHLIQASEITYQAKEETVTIQFNEALPLGNGKVNMDFTGILNDKMMGFYRSRYTPADAPNETRYCATTQFEPTGARRAFPSWDEPALKATFDIILTVPENRIALSNMEETSCVSLGNGLKKCTYARTPIMSTYLLAFVVGEFDHVTGTSKEGVEVRVFTPVGKKDTGVFGVDVATKVLSYFGEYYGIPYPLKKMDMIAIADFSAGAMENWGLVTYRETALLIDQKSAGVASKQRVAYVIAHELAHQWFGNLVTMEWWKELWLNEGFATFVGMQAIGHLFPQWDIWTQFVSQYINRALDLDSLKSSHPVEVEVHSSAEIEEIFDIISYNKGASIIRMIANIVGEDKFRKGLNIYLNRHKYANAVTEDLWNALSEASGFNVKEFMDNYTKATGYPLVSIEPSESGESFKVTQRRFLADGSTDPANPHWWVSLTLSTPDNKVTRHEIKFTENSTIEAPHCKNVDWVKANVDQAGFFRVKYAPSMAHKLSAAVEKLALPATDRIGIQSDAFALSKAGVITAAEALTLVKGYVNEVDYTVWSDLQLNLQTMYTVWSFEPSAADFKAFNRGLFTKIYQKLGWEVKPGESDLDTLLRATVLSQMGYNDDAEVIAEAKKRFHDHVTQQKTLPADLRALVYALVVSNGGKDEYEQVLKIYETAEMHEEKLRALRALGAASDPALLNRTLELGLTEAVRAQDIFFATAPVSANPKGRDLAWEFFKKNFEGFKKRIGDSAMVFDRVIQYFIKYFTAEEAAKDVEKFFAENPVPNADRTIKQGLEGIRGNAKWLNANRAVVADWLKANKY